MNELVLSGCRAKPLASYLKALGILRLISEQRDNLVKGWWQGESFVISTKLSKEDFEAFFCDAYAPTPIVSPWNGGSGFYLGDAMEGLEAITKTETPRFTDYRNAILQIKSWPEIPSFNTVEDVINPLRSTLQGMRPGKKRNDLERLIQDVEASVPKNLGGKRADQMALDEIEAFSKERDISDRDEWKRWWGIVKKARTQCNTIKRNENKTIILPRCRARLSDSGLQWLDAICALHLGGRASFNPVLGTGGNEGRLELSNNFMQRVAELLITGDPEKTKDLFNSATFDAVLSGLISAKIGQYDPGRAGGYNQGTEVETKDFKINPWDFVLAIEGALVLAGAVVRRNPTEDRSRYTIPFTVRFSSVGFSSSSYQESGRQEIWMPMWRNPATYPEIKYLFGEGRSCLGRRVARNGIDFSRAVGTLGVDRGIDAFERYAFLERRGKSYVALPAGRIKVRYRPELELLNELDAAFRPAWVFMQRFKNVPATFQSARQKIDEAIFLCSQKPGASSFSYLVRAIGNLERLFAFRDRSKDPALNRPLHGLSPRWIVQCDDGDIEVRIAGALASIHATDNVGPFRSNLAGVDPVNPQRWSAGKGDFCWFGNSLPERLAGALSRRMMDAERRSAHCVPIEASISISPYDVMPFLWGECDEAKIEDLLWGFSLIDWRKMGVPKIKKHWKKPINQDYPLSRAWCILKLLHSPDKIRNVAIRREQRIAHLLMAGRTREACDVAIHRLKVSELHPFDVAYEEQLDSMRLLASLLIPIKDQWKLESLVLEDKTSNS